MPLQTFTATPTMNAGQVQWTLCYTVPNPDQCGKTKDTYPDIQLPQDQPNQPFQFRITNDNTGLNIKFADTDPIWIQANSQPTGPGVHPQITTPGGAGQKVLTFVDLNTLPNPNQPQSLVLKYQLNFTDGQGNVVTPIEPDIRNGGTTTPPPPPPPSPGYIDGGVSSSSVYLTAALISAIVAALVAYLVVRLMRPSGP